MIHKLQAGYVNARTSRSLQTLAALRRAPIDSPGTDPELWELTLGELPEELQGRGDDPSRAELSIHAALVLYAVHQQSQGTPMHQPGVVLGRAVARLAISRGSAGEPEPGVIRKFHRICSAQLRSSRLQELRSLMTFMRSSGIPLDHAQLGVDLFLLEGPKTRDGVILNWGRNLHRREQDTHDTEKSSTSPLQEANN
ncbi:MAG: type I-E CRISPR-associated protein Cse2/CasB [Propionibacterium sp.]|nr:type I-E CRISPR-associated protein Cse2/CasB [Propionibacterium sp.]